MQNATVGRFRILNKVVRGLLVGSFLALLPIVGFAHAKLVRSEPSAKAKLTQAPKLVELWFSEELEPDLGTIEVKNQQGTKVDIGDVVLAKDSRKLQKELGPLESGVYTVSWKAISADEHAMRGSFTFTLTTATSMPASRAPEGRQPNESMSLDSPETPTNSDSDLSEKVAWSQTLARWTSYLAMMMIFGSFAFWTMVLRPAFSKIQERGEVLNAMMASESRMLLLAWSSIGILFLASGAALLIQAANVFDTSLAETFSLYVIRRTLASGYGIFWIFQVISTVVVSLIMLAITIQKVRIPAASQTTLWWIGLAASAILVFTPSWTGHALASSREFRLSVVADWFHLLAAGFWVGGLFHLVLTLPKGLTALAPPRRGIALHQAISCFTRVAMPSVAILGLAGLYSAWAHIPRLDGLWKTPYGKILVVKLGIVGLMLLLGAIHSFHFGKRFARAVEDASSPQNSKTQSTLHLRFFRSVALEAALGALVLLVTAILVFMTPARSHPAMDKTEPQPAQSEQRR